MAASIAFGSCGFIRSLSTWRDGAISERPVSINTGTLLIPFNTLANEIPSSPMAYLAEVRDMLQKSIEAESAEDSDTAISA